MPFYLTWGNSAGENKPNLLVVRVFAACWGLPADRWVGDWRTVERCPGVGFLFSSSGAVVRESTQACQTAVRIAEKRRALQCRRIEIG